MGRKNDTEEDLMRKKFIIILFLFFLLSVLATAGFSVDAQERQVTVPGHVEEVEDLCIFAWNILSGSDGTGSEPLEALEDFLRPAGIPSIAISFPQRTASFLVSPGYGTDLERAILESCSAWQDKTPPDHLILEILEDISAETEFSSSEVLELLPGLQGLLVRVKGKDPVAVLTPAELLFSGEMDEKGSIRISGLQRLLQRKTGGLPFGKIKGDLLIRTFSSRAGYYDGKEFLPLFRGHRVVDVPGKDLLRKSIENGGAYLARSVLPDGRFIYSYQADRDRINSGYNILRHFGTIFAMLEVYEHTGQKEILDSALRAFRHLENSFYKDNLKGIPVGKIVEKGYMKLGGNALALLAMTKYTSLTGDKRFLKDMEMLARWMVLTQGEKGNFTIHKQSYPGGRISDFMSSYYPGEAIFSLVRLYGVQANPLWLDTAEKAARYLILERDRGKSSSRLPHDHWLLYGLNELFRLRPEQIYLDHAFRIADGIVASQNLDPPYPDWRGSYYKPPRSTPTATRSEGLMAAYRLARDHGQQERAERYLEAVERGITFQLSTQILDESAFHFPDPLHAMGGFRESLTGSEIRIDYVQHNLSSIIGYVNEMEKN